MLSELTGKELMRMTFNRKSKDFIIILFRIVQLLILIITYYAGSAQTRTNPVYYIDQHSSYFVTPDTWAVPPSGGDTVFISPNRTKALRFQFIAGSEENPVVVMNDGGQVSISDSVAWGAIVFENCRYIKLSGEGTPEYFHGFVLKGLECGLAFTELSSDCEASNLIIDHDGFFGIMAKRDYQGLPPKPIPVFFNLIIHDCLIQNVTEGMYLGETTSPGQEFRHVRIYNNIVRNTGRESIQIANMVEDVEIFNNTLLNAGMLNIRDQRNILQIGDNSVANVHDNILIGAPGYGIISFGAGDNFFNRNFISACQGIFIDNRKFSFETKPVCINNNFFCKIQNTDKVISNMNEVNQLEITNNMWDTDVDFYHNESGNNANINLNNNVFSLLSVLLIADQEQSTFSKAGWNSSTFTNLGAPKFSNTGKSLKTIHSASNIGSKSVNNPKDNTYKLEFDLEMEYSLKKIIIHDMTSSNYLEVLAGEPDNWRFLFSDSYQKFNLWREHETNIKTRYLKINTEFVLNASSNEYHDHELKSNPLSFFLNPEEILSSNLIVDGISDTNWKRHPTVFLCQNIVTDELCINIPDNVNRDFTIEIFNLAGSKLLQRKFRYNGFSRVILDVSAEPWRNGFYIMKYKNCVGYSESIKFLKWKK